VRGVGTPDCRYCVTVSLCHCLGVCRAESSPSAGHLSAGLNCSAHSATLSEPGPRGQPPASTVDVASGPCYTHSQKEQDASQRASRDWPTVPRATEPMTWNRDATRRTKGLGEDRMSQERISGLQQAIDDEGHSWTAGLTSVSELSREEQARRLGLRLDPYEVAKVVTQMAQATPRAGEYPTGWDWRDVGGMDWTTPIRDQQACGSCVAFGTVAVLEAMLKRHYDDATLQVDLSEAYLFFCGCGDCCDTGWWPTDALDFAQSTGVPDEACFPYRDQNTPCTNACQDWRDRAIQVAGWRELVDAAERKEWLSSTVTFSVTSAASIGTPAAACPAITLWAWLAIRSKSRPGSAKTAGVQTGVSQAGSRSATASVV
jgi:hypothetical protein